MKQRHIMPLLAASLALASCQPESPADLAGGLLLNIENTASAGAKPAVSGITTTWLDGDLITLNGTDCTVQVNGYAAKVQNATKPHASEHWFATSPAGLVASPEGAGEFWWEERLAANESFQFSYPREYTYAASFQRQMVAFPMVAVAAGSAGSLTFRHLAAAVQVQVETPMLMPIRLDSVVLEATSACLNGDASFTVDASFVPSISAPTSATPASYARRSVRLNCSGSTSIVFSNQPLRIQLPVPPLPAGEELTVRVYGTTVMPLANIDEQWNRLAMRNSPSWGNVNEFVFSHSAVLASALERTHLINARAEVRPDGHLLDSERSISRLSLFSVSDTKKVLFKRDQDATSVSDPYSMPSLGEMQYLMHSRPGARFIRVNVNSRMSVGSTPYIIIFPDGHTVESVRGLEGMEVLDANYFNATGEQVFSSMFFEEQCHKHGFVVLRMHSGSNTFGSYFKYKLEGGYLTPDGGLPDADPFPSSERSLLVRPIIGY